MAAMPEGVRRVVQTSLDFRKIVELLSLGDLETKNIRSTSQFNNTHCHLHATMRRCTVGVGAVDEGPP